MITSPRIKTECPRAPRTHVACQTGPRCSRSRIGTLYRRGESRTQTVNLPSLALQLSAGLDNRSPDHIDACDARSPAVRQTPADLQSALASKVHLEETRDCTSNEIEEALSDTSPLTSLDSDSVKSDTTGSASSDDIESLILAFGQVSVKPKAEISAAVNAKSINIEDLISAFSNLLIDNQPKLVSTSGTELDTVWIFDIPSASSEQAPAPASSGAALFHIKHQPLITQSEPPLVLATPDRDTLISAPTSALRPTALLFTPQTFRTRSLALPQLLDPSASPFTPSSRSPTQLITALLAPLNPLSQSFLPAAIAATARSGNRKHGSTLRSALKSPMLPSTQSTIPKKSVWFGRSVDYRCIAAQNEGFSARECTKLNTDEEHNAWRDYWLTGTWLDEFEYNPSAETDETTENAGKILEEEDIEPSQDSTESCDTSEYYSEETGIRADCDLVGEDPSFPSELGLLSQCDQLHLSDSESYDISPLNILHHRTAQLHFLPTILEEDEDELGGEVAVFEADISRQLSFVSDEDLPLDLLSPELHTLPCLLYQDGTLPRLYQDIRDEPTYEDRSSPASVNLLSSSPFICRARPGAALGRYEEDCDGQVCLAGRYNLADNSPLARRDKTEWRGSETQRSRLSWADMMDEEAEEEAEAEAGEIGDGLPLVESYDEDFSFSSEEHSVTGEVADGEDVEWAGLASGIDGQEFVGRLADSEVEAYDSDFEIKERAL